jgi:hypothetical protein
MNIANEQGNILHEKKFIFELPRNIAFCFNCSGAIVSEKTGKEISTIRPRKYEKTQENCMPIFLSLSDLHNPYIFMNKEQYLLIRNKLVKNMKSICESFDLQKSTYFLALDYFDRICSRMKGFELSSFEQISKICIILATKFQENGKKGAEIQSQLRGANYANDELYILKILNYDLQIFTAYDVLIDILYTGFLFTNESFPKKKMHILYTKVEKILYIFSENKYYIDMTYKEIALSIIGFIREMLGLSAFTKQFQMLFMNNSVELNNYIYCLNTIKKCFKFKEDNTHQRQNSESAFDTCSYNCSQRNNEEKVACKYIEH